MITDPLTLSAPKAVRFTLGSPPLPPHALKNTGATSTRVLRVELKHAH